MFTLLTNPFSAGIASTAIFVVLNLLGMSSILLMLSAIPLLFIGYSSQFSKLVTAGATASGILLLFNPISSLFFIACIAVPTFFLCAHQQKGHTIAHAIADICGYALLSLVMIHLVNMENGGIPGWISAHFDLASMQTVDPKILQQLQWLSSDGSYLLVGMVVWWSIIFMLISSWITEKLLKNDEKSVGLAPIQYFSSKAIPLWLLPVMIFSILIGFFAPENIRFLGLLSFVIILLPYFFSGAMYTPLRKTLENSLGWSLVITTIMLVLAWPALLVVMVGVFKHAQQQFR